MEEILDENKDISAIEMGCDEVQLYCTIGKIKVWFSKQTNEDMVRQVLQCFSRIDSSFSHEKEIICDYDRISVYENHDYTLISYGKVEGGYRAIFNIQFSKQNALSHFIETILKELKQGELNKTFHWNGSMARIMLIHTELNHIPGWDIIKIEYKPEEEQ